MCLVPTWCQNTLTYHDSLMIYVLRNPPFLLVMALPGCPEVGLQQDSGLASRQNADPHLGMLS